MEALLARASEVVGLLGKPGADPDGSLTRQSAHDLRAIHAALASQVQGGPGLGLWQSRQIWELACSIWNACVDAGNAGSQLEPCYAQLRHVASDLASLAHDENETSEEVACRMRFFHATGQAYMGCGEAEAAEACFARAAEQAAALARLLGAGDPAAAEQLAEVGELRLDRARNAWQLQQPELAEAELGKAQALAASEELAAAAGVQLALAIVRAKLEQASRLLERAAGADGEEKAAGVGRAAALLEGAYEAVAGLQEPEAAPEADAAAAGTRKLHCKVLSCLALAHVMAGESAAAAMSCVEKLRELEAADPHTSFLALEALLQLQRPKEAEGELLALASAEAAPAQLVLDAAAALMEAPGFGGSVRSALAMLLRRPGDGGATPARVLELVLGRVDGQAACEEYEAVALNLVREEEVMSALLAEQPPPTEAGAEGQQSAGGGQREQVHALLWSHAARHFQARQHAQAAAFFAADLQLAPPPAQARAARALAMCSLGTGELDRALEYVEVAHTHEPGSLYSHLIAFKAQLGRADAAAACGELAAMLASADFSPEVLSVAAHEALAAQQPGVALQALERLAGLAAADGGGEGAAQQQEATVLLNLVRVSLEAAERAGAAPHAAALPHLRTAVARARAVGPPAFFPASGGRRHHLDWLAACAWNQALAAAGASDHEAALGLFAAAADLHAMQPEQTPETLQTEEMSCLMAATTALEHHAGAGEAASLAAADGLLERARAARQRRQREHSEPVAAGDKAAVFHLLQAFEVGARKGDSGRLAGLLGEAQRCAGVSAEHYVRMAALCRGAPGGQAGAEAGCLSRALRLLTQRFPLAQLDLVAQVLRRLLCLSNSDEERLGLYADARGLLADLPPAGAEGAFPPREAAWLATTCFNRGCSNARFGRRGQAARFMQAALALLPFCPGLQAREAHMRAQLAKAEAGDDGSRGRPTDMEE